METLKLLALTGLIATAPYLALANVGLGDKLGTTEADIRAALEGQGYQIEDGEIEVELVKDSLETELVHSKTDGVVTAIELEQDDD